MIFSLKNCRVFLEKNRFYLLLFSFLLLTFCLSLPLFTPQEQSFTIQKIAKGFSLTWTDLIGDFNPPTLFMFVSLFSKDLFGVMLVSFVVSLIAIFLLFRALSERFGQTEVFFGLLFLILSPLGNYYLFGVRQESFCFLFSAFIVFFYSRPTDQWRFEKMVLAAVAATYFSYLNFFLLAAVLLVLFLERAPLKNYFLSLFALPGVAFALIHYQYMSAGHWDTLNFFSFVQNISSHIDFVSGLLSLTVLAVLVPLITLAILFFIRKDLWGAFKVQVLYVCMLLLSGIIFPTAYFPRYYFPSIFFIYILFAVRLKNRSWLSILAVIFLALSLLNYFRLFEKYGIRLL